MLRKLQSKMVFMTQNSPASDKISSAKKKSRRESPATKIASLNPGKSNNNVLKDQKYEIVDILDPSPLATVESLSNRIITRDSNGQLHAMIYVKAFQPKKPISKELTYLKEIDQI